MTQWIAEERVVIVQRDGTRVAGRIAVGAPIVRDRDCACEIVVEGLEPARTICGDSTLQALLLAIRFLGMRLHDQRSKGVRFELEGDQVPDPGAPDADVDVVALLFGPLLRATTN